MIDFATWMLLASFGQSRSVWFELDITGRLVHHGLSGDRLTGCCTIDECWLIKGTLS